MINTEACESWYVIFCDVDVTDSLVAQTVEGTPDGIRWIRSGTRAVLEFKTPFPDACKGKKKYSKDEVEVLIEDENIFIPCDETAAEDASVKSQILCADDLKKEFEWTEINGVRRVTKITFSSAAYNVQTSTTTTIERTFTYQGSAPFDLTQILDVVNVS